jgi:dual specificity protein kinase YAK1
VRCKKIETEEYFAVKVIKNKQAYYLQAKTEILILKVLNKEEMNSTKRRIVKLFDFFIFRNHFCLVFEMLDWSLYDLLENTNFNGFNFSMIRMWTK